MQLNPVANIVTSPAVSPEHTQSSFLSPSVDLTYSAAWPFPHIEGITVINCGGGLEPHAGCCATVHSGSSLRSCSATRAAAILSLTVIAILASPCGGEFSMLFRPSIQHSSCSPQARLALWSSPECRQHRSTLCCHSVSTLNPLPPRTGHRTSVPSPVMSTSGDASCASAASL